LSELDAPAGRADARAHARALRVHAHIGLGSALSDLGEPGEAETHLRAAIDAGAESASLHAALGLMRVKQGKLAEAAEDLAEARKLDPRLWRVHYLDGLLAEADKDWPRARAAYTRALDASPALATVRERLQFVQTQETP
ncbi:MAG: tetratricopeptide repeat protein, partial [Planctomycetes bacterium]|nr:tetratricopeptide repeat protein [Planctomycetota bacterium]